MKFQKQLYFHRPDEGSYGDCQRTVVACFLDLDAQDVPHFNDGMPGAEVFNERYDGYLASRGLARMMTVFDGSAGLNQVLQTMKSVNPGMYYCLSGMSETGVNHVVIAKDDAVVWDTSLNDSGIVGPCTDGYFWVDVFVPAFMKCVPT